MSGLFGRSLRAPLLALLLAGTTLHGPALAQESGPTLVARVAGINSEAMQSRKLLIDSLDIRVRIHGSVAETIVTARFGNAGRDNLEGEFTLAMPAGSVAIESAAPAAMPSGRLHAAVISTGRPWDQASSTATGRPSLSDGSTKASARAKLAALS